MLPGCPMKRIRSIRCAPIDDGIVVDWASTSAPTGYTKEQSQDEQTRRDRLAQKSHRWPHPSPPATQVQQDHREREHAGLHGHREGIHA